MTATVDYYYSAHSAYAYLGATRLYEICAATGARLVHRPILLSPVVEAAGGQPFRGRSQAHVDYFFGREIERWADWRGVPVVRFRPTHHDASYDLANRLIIAAQDLGLGADRLSFALLQGHWRDDADLSDRSFLNAALTGCGIEPDACIDAAETQAVIARHRANTDAAIALSIFGSPTYVVDGDPFYGQDRLDLVERAITRPFAPHDWRNPPVAGT